MVHALKACVLVLLLGFVAAQETTVNPCVSQQVETVRPTPACCNHSPVQQKTSSYCDLLVLVHSALANVLKVLLVHVCYRRVPGLSWLSWSKTRNRHKMREAFMSLAGLSLQCRHCLLARRHC